MSERGFFALDRGWFEHPSFQREPYTQREAWAWLISEAAFKPVVRRIGAVSVSLLRGQVAHSLRYMADKWQWSEPRVRRFLTRLKTDAMLLVASDAGVTVLTICNYNKYQRAHGAADAAIDAPNDAGATQDRRKEEELKNLRTDVVDEGARLLSDSAFEIAAELGRGCGFKEPLDWPPSWAGAPMRVQTWLNSGWRKDEILAASQEALAKKRDGPPSSINYFEKPIASFIAKQSAPLPEVKIQEREIISVVRQDAKSRSKDDFRRALGELRSYAAEGDRGPRDQDVRLLPPAGRN